MIASSISFLFFEVGDKIMVLWKKKAFLSSERSSKTLSEDTITWISTHPEVEMKKSKKIAGGYFVEAKSISVPTEAGARLRWYFYSDDGLGSEIKVEARRLLGILQWRRTRSIVKEWASQVLGIETPDEFILY